MNNRIISFAAALLFAVTSATTFADFVLADHGSSNVSICVNPSAADTVQLAARELQKHVQLVTGAELPIVNHPAPAAGFTLFLGDSDFSRAKGIDTRTESNDGFRILSGDNWLIIAGKDYGGPPLTAIYNPYRRNETYNEALKLSAFGTAGTLQGVYYFLGHYLGVRWYMPGELGVVAPKQATVRIAAIDVHKSPAFEYRYPYTCFFSNSEDDSLWHRRAGFGAPFPVAISHSFGTRFIQYKDSHPEYFALIDGQRDFTTLSSTGPGNLNLSNPALLQQAISDIDDYFDKSPAESVFSLCPNDGMTRISEDPESQAQIVPNLEAGRFSNYVWDFIDKVARGVAIKHPDKYIGCIAYEDYVRAPTNLKTLSPNVIVMICKRRGDYTDPKNRATVDATIAEWKEKARTIYCWEYYCDIIMNAGWKGYPSFYPALVQQDLQALKGITKGEFIEAESWTIEQYAHPQDIKMNYPGLQHPLLYVTGRLLWEPNLDLKSLMDEYYHLFYGPAEADMRAFWELAEQSWMKKGDAIAPPQVFDRDTLRRMLASIEKGRSETELNSDYRQRVELIESEFKPATQKAVALEKVKGAKPEIPYLAETTPVIDGRLEPLWAKSPLLPLIDRNYVPAQPVTHLRMGWTKEALYLSVACYEPSMDKLVATATQRDASSDTPIWSDDSVEIYLKSGSEPSAKLYQFIVNSLGTLWDASRDGNGQIHPQWNSHARLAVAKESFRWVIEMEIPWKDLGVSEPKEGLQIAGNVFRNRFAGESSRQFSLFPLLTSRYADSENLGPLVLSPSKP